VIEVAVNKAVASMPKVSLPKSLVLQRDDKRRVPMNIVVYVIGATERSQQSCSFNDEGKFTKVIDVAARRQAKSPHEHSCLCDWGDRAQSTKLQLQ